MNPPVDLAVYDRNGALVLLAEVKARKGTSREWAQTLRRNLLAHGLPRAPYFLLVTPEESYLWTDKFNSGREQGPDGAVPTTELLGKQITASTSGPAYHEESLALLVAGWLSDLARGTDAPTADLRQLVHLSEAIRGGRVDLQPAA